MADYTAKSTFSLFKTSASEFIDNNSLLLAAALAFNAIFSIPPLLVIIIRAAGFFLGEQAVSGELSNQISSAIGPNAAQEIETIIQNAHQSESSGLAFWIGLGTLVFASTTFFATLQQSLNMVWNLKPKPTSGILNMLKVRLFSFGIVLSIALLMLVSLLLSTVISILSDYLSSIFPDIGVFVIQLVDIVLSVGIITALFGLVFHYLPDAIIRWRDVWVGAFITAVLFTIGKVLIGWFIGTSDPGSAYGAAGSMVVILVWIYYTSLIVLFGAEFTQQYAEAFGQRIRPKHFAVFVEEREVVEERNDIASGRPQPEGRFEPKK
ncbi:YihY/virulence factor BrkB family protein [Pontibacter diazotrophicus]|uniref:YihY/virulence factor BrkB family protein n=1 Tax=Pontibacter diazotrophicus TaxID=1400979 RepID=A0A3D8KZN5_9BACT|nr:YihY/virulence factor BrkB family protein [Pontibacter diazotrophicus]RDV10684.1 YihY/virulence factor BrkB family protein [Pontibacter diazotrophicus]